MTHPAPRSTSGADDRLVGRPKLLVVDDTPQNIKVAHERPDLVLLDIVMPDLDGYEVCRRLRAEPETRLLPVVMISNMASVPRWQSGFEQGVAPTTRRAQAWIVLTTPGQVAR